MEGAPPLSFALCWPRRSHLSTASTADTSFARTKRCPGARNISIPKNTNLKNAIGTRPVTLKRSEEHTSELQSLAYLVCRLLLEKKKKNKYNIRQMINII